MIISYTYPINDLDILGMMAIGFGLGYLLAQINP